MKCLLGRIEFTMIDSGPNVRVNALCEEEGLDQIVSIEDPVADPYRRGNLGTFSQQSFEEFCNDEVEPAIAWD